MLAPVTSTNATGNLASLSSSIFDSSDDTETMPINCHFESTVVENEIQIELNAATMPIAVEDESSNFQGKSLLSNERDLSLLNSIKAWSILEPNVPHAAVTRLLQCLNNFHPQLPKTYHTLFPPLTLQYEPMNDGLYVHIPNCRAGQVRKSVKSTISLVFYKY